MRISDGSSDVCSSDLMAGVVQVEKGVEFLQGDVDDAQIPALDYAFQTLPAGVDMYSLRGPLFFGAARSLRHALEALPTPPRGFILPMRPVPRIDASGVAPLCAFLPRSRARRVAVNVSRIPPPPNAALAPMGTG